jgi:hypothetical protein
MDAALDEITMPTEIVAAIGEGALAYRESGILSLADGRVFSACRQYRYRLSEDSVVVEFADGPHIGTQFLSLSFSRTDTGLKRVASMPAETTPTMQPTGFWGRRPLKWSSWSKGLQRHTS